jgi:hypothetical protein
VRKNSNRHRLATLLNILHADSVSVTSFL